jgi:membrane protease YdiL (CAAX protease family)
MADAKESEALRPGASAGLQPVRHLVPLALAFYGLVLAAAVAWRLWADGAWPWAPASGRAPWPLSARLLAGLGYGAALVVASRAWTARSAAGRRLSQELAAAVGPIGAPAALLLAAVSGLAEEAFFRGALQPRVGWLLATLLFGLAHFHPRRELRAWSVSAGLAGLGFAALFELSGDLLAPALAHGTVNAINLRWLGAQHRSEHAHS